MILVLSLHLIFAQKSHSLAHMQNEFHRIQESSERRVVGSPWRTEHSEHCTSTDSLEKIHIEQENMDEIKLFPKITIFIICQVHGLLQSFSAGIARVVCFLKYMKHLLNF